VTNRPLDRDFRGTALAEPRDARTTAVAPQNPSHSFQKATSRQRPARRLTITFH
jgi:hypothetical protein